MAAITITKDNFNKEVMNPRYPSCWTSGLLVRPCRMVGPLVEQLSEELEGQAKVGR